MLQPRFPAPDIAHASDLGPANSFKRLLVLEDHPSKAANGEVPVMRLALDDSQPLLPRLDEVKAGLELAMERQLRG